MCVLDARWNIGKEFHSGLDDPLELQALSEHQQSRSAACGWLASKRGVMR